MAALRSRCGHYIFILWFVLSCSFFPHLISTVRDWMSTVLPLMVWPYCKFRMQVWNVLRVALWKYRTQKSPKRRHLGSIPQLCRAIFSQLRHVSTIWKKNLLSSNISSTWPHNMVNFGPLAADIFSLVWGTPANFSGFRVSAALLYCTPVVGVSQTLRRWTEDSTYIRQGGHHVGHWPTFLDLDLIFNISQYEHEIPHVF